MTYNNQQQIAIVCGMNSGGSRIIDLTNEYSHLQAHNLIGMT